MEGFLDVRSATTECALLGALPAPAIRPRDSVVRYPRKRPSTGPAFLRRCGGGLVRPPFAPLVLYLSTWEELALPLALWPDADGRGHDTVLLCELEWYDRLFDIEGWIDAGVTTRALDQAPQARP